MAGHLSGVHILLSVVTAFTLPVVEACGGGHGASPNAPDGSAPMGTTMYDGAISDASKDSAPTGTTDATNDRAIPAAGTATLVGPQAFAVGSALMGPPLTGGCGGTTADRSSTVSQASIILTSQGLPSLLCADAGLPDGGTGFWIDIEIATTQAAMGDQELTQSLAPGTYVIGNEGENDPDLCMLPNGSTAFLQLLTPTGYDAQAIAISGTVIIDSVGIGSITGSFSVLMGGPYGFTDASPPPSLSGAFNALACP